MKELLVIICLVLVVSCSGDDASSAEVPEAEAPDVTEPTNNPLAEEQAFMKEAAKVQDVLDMDAERKKKAVENAN